MLPDTNKKDAMNEKNKKKDNNSKDKSKIICHHEFITDDIDLTPDRSQRIVYCTKCFITKKLCK
jgi:hypothetical protein